MELNCWVEEECKFVGGQGKVLIVWKKSQEEVMQGKGGNCSKFL
jgi:hypothetical protein